MHWVASGQVTTFSNNYLLGPKDPQMQAAKQRRGIFGSGTMICTVWLVLICHSLIVFYMVFNYPEDIVNWVVCK